MSQLSIHQKLTVRDNDSKWTENAKKIINAIMDYASKTNKFRTVRIGEHAEVDNCPGFYITFPDLDSQDRLAYSRSDNTFSLVCLITIKSNNYKDALEELLECYGEFAKKLDQDHSMEGKPTGVPEVGVPNVYSVEPTGLGTGSGVRAPAQSFEYLYGLSVVTVKLKQNLRG